MPFSREEFVTDIIHAFQVANPPLMAGLGIVLVGWTSLGISVSQGDGNWFGVCNGVYCTLEVNSDRTEPNRFEPSWTKPEPNRTDLRESWFKPNQAKRVGLVPWIGSPWLIVPHGQCTYSDYTLFTQAAITPRNTPFRGYNYENQSNNPIPCSVDHCICPIQGHIQSLMGAKRTRCTNAYQQLVLCQAVCLCMSEWHWNWQTGLEDEASGMKLRAKHSASLFEHHMLILPIHMRKIDLICVLCRWKKFRISFRKLGV
jgi:hypothetical protein